MATFHTKLRVVEAMRWDGDADLANRFIGEAYGEDWQYTFKESSDIWICAGRYARCPTLCRVGNWIIKAEVGALDVLSDEEFTYRYEPHPAPERSEP